MESNEVSKYTLEMQVFSILYFHQIIYSDVFIW